MRPGGNMCFGTLDKIGEKRYKDKLLATQPILILEVYLQRRKAGSQSYVKNNTSRFTAVAYIL
jgi:hypothetical protein